MALIRGDVLQNRYRITALLARGGMAAIYRGWHTTLNVPIAILVDSTDSITLLLGRRVFNAFPNRDRLVAGTQVEVVGEIHECHGELTIIPATEKGVKIIK